MSLNGGTWSRYWVNSGEPGPSSRWEYWSFEQSPGGAR
jgi:hypothetical protein